VTAREGVGQAKPLGPRAQRTQQRILGGLAMLLQHKKLAAISVGEIAIASDVSPATFYRYFADVESVALKLAWSLADDLQTAVAKAELPWDGPDGRANAEAFVTEFLAHWDRNAPILRMRNHLADDGDDRFREVRLQTLRRLTPAILAKLRAHQAAGDIEPELDVRAAVNIVLGMLERVGAFQHQYRGGTRTAIRTATVIVHNTVCGQAAMKSVSNA
jgi:AcrR family transcriptional regulator